MMHMGDAEIERRDEYDPPRRHLGQQMERDDDRAEDDLLRDGTLECR